VTASDLAGNISDHSIWDSITPDLTPPTFSNINAGSITENSVTITWDTNEPATSQVEYGEEIAYGSQTVFDPTLVISHSVVVIGLDAWTTYHYRAKSDDADGNPGISGDNEFTTDDNGAPVITDVNAVATADSVTITWTTDEPATSLVRYGETVAYGDEGTVVGMTTSHNVTITGLSDETTYHYQVESTDAADNTSTSSDRTFAHDETAPAAPTGVDVVVVS
jgi:hypothetical protein